MNKKEKEKKNKIKQARKARRDSPKYKLRVYWHKHRHAFGVKKLLYIAREIDYPEIQKSALREILNRRNLTFADFYRMLSLPEEILKLDPKIEDRMWKYCFDIATPDNLRELIDLGEVKAALELFKRFDNGSMNPAKAKQILISLFERSDDENIRKECWKRIEAIGPNEDELKYLLDSKRASGLHRYIEKLLAKRSERKTDIAIVKIKQLVKEIKQRQE